VNSYQPVKPEWKERIMADFVSLTCPSCNGKLQIGKDLDRFACGYCGTEFVVNRGGR